MRYKAICSTCIHRVIANYMCLILNFVVILINIVATILYQTLEIVKLLQFCNKCLIHYKVLASDSAAVYYKHIFSYLAVVRFRMKLSQIKKSKVICIIYSRNYYW